MKTSDAGRRFIEQWEGLFLKTYDDGVGVLTIGYGHTSAAGPPKVIKGMTITLAECDAILARDLGKVEADVNRLVKVPLTQAQFDTLVSFQFNVGKLGSSTLLKKLNAGNYAAVPTELMKWNKGGGKVMLGLTRRRKAEGVQWNTVIAPAKKLPTITADTVIKTARTTAGVAVGVGGTAEGIKAVVGPVGETVTQVRDITDNAGQVVATTKEVVTAAPDGLWLHLLHFFQRPSVLLAIIVFIGLAWVLTYYLRTHKDNPA